LFFYFWTAKNIFKKALQIYRSSHHCQVFFKTNLIILILIVIHILFKKQSFVLIAKKMSDK